MPDRFAALWARVGARGDAAAACEDLLARHAEPHRAYHVIAHVEHCLDELEPVRALAAAPDAIEWAVWFHDAVYDTRSDDNESRSARLAGEVARGAGLPEGFAELVATLVLATRHRAVPHDADARLLVDVDLAILGAEPHRYDEYERRIREEFAWVPDDRFAAARASVLRAFLDRPTIYATETFREKYEVRARRNMTQALARCEASQSGAPPQPGTDRR